MSNERQEGPSDVWSQRLRELDRIGGLGLSALILFGLYRLVTLQLTAYNGMLVAVADAQQSVAESQVRLVTQIDVFLGAQQVANELLQEIAEDHDGVRECYILPPEG
jgi:hypothetical protein